jgi:CubicO group peptidase (beta-lactamase class C family)
MRGSLWRLSRPWAWSVLVALPLAAGAPVPSLKADDPAPVYYPPPETRGGWRSLVPDRGDPAEADKARITRVGGVNWDRLKAAWDYNQAAGGRTALLVIRHGHVVGEWYQGCDRARAFNLYSSSKGYTSTAFGMLLGDSAAGRLPGGRKLTLDTKVCTADWLPEALPLSDPRKADITLRHLLTMTSGVGPEPLPRDAPFAAAMGHVEGSPLARLKGPPGAVYNYSDANILHLVLLFRRAAGRDLLPYLKERLFAVIGQEPVSWVQIGDEGQSSPFPLSQGFSGLHTTARGHARFCYLALHRGRWAGQAVVPAAYYDFAWQGTKAKPDYGALWWVHPRHPEAPRDLVQTAGALNNHGYVVPSLDLVFVRLGDGQKYPKDFEKELVKRVLAAAEK